MNTFWFSIPAAVLRRPAKWEALTATCLAAAQLSTEAWTQSGHLPRRALWFSLGLFIFSSVPALSQGRDMGCSPTVANPCKVGPGNVGGGYTPSERNYRREEREAEELERAQRNAEYADVHKRVDEAWTRGDYREALRLLRVKQGLRDGPNVRESIVQVRGVRLGMLHE